VKAPPHDKAHDVKSARQHILREPKYICRLVAAMKSGAGTAQTQIRTPFTPIRAALTPASYQAHPNRNPPVTPPPITQSQTPSLSQDTVTFNPKGPHTEMSASARFLECQTHWCLWSSLNPTPPAPIPEPQFTRLFGFLVCCVLCALDFSGPNVHPPYRLS
jgi:hypothetical protein